jgi:hypothetical protein
MKRRPGRRNAAKGCGKGQWIQNFKFEISNQEMRHAGAGSRSVAKRRKRRASIAAGFVEHSLKAR